MKPVMARVCAEILSLCGAAPQGLCEAPQGRREVEVGQVALKRPAVGHFLAASDSRLRDPREHEAFGRRFLCIRATCPAQSSVRLAR